MPAPDSSEDRVLSTRPPDWERVRDRFTKDLSRLTLGIVRGRPDGFWLGPLALIRLGPPELHPDGVRWPVTGGLLAQRPGGWVGVEWRQGQLRGWLAGYWPSIPRPIYNLTQRVAHHELTRLYLLSLRGRLPLPAREAPRGRRLAAAAVDLGLCVLIARGRPRRALGAATAYHLAAWTVGGRTLGGALFGQRLVSVDGSGVSPGQAVARLLLAPAGARRQDAVAATAVVGAAEFQTATESQ